MRAVRARLHDAGGGPPAYAPCALSGRTVVHADSRAVFNGALANYAGLVSWHRLGGCAMRTALLKQSAIELVCSMLKDHPDASGVQLEGCITLASLAKEDEAVKQLIGRAGGPSLVQAAMQRHKKCSDLQRWGHKGLLAITPSEDYNQATQKYERKY